LALLELLVRWAPLELKEIRATKAIRAIPEKEAIEDGRAPLGLPDRKVLRDIEVMSEVPGRLETLV
tara:strand:- start:339 stop:536 length:198 start_codon:yes stop_codon:yes gene_type:complete